MRKARPALGLLAEAGKTAAQRCTLGLEHLCARKHGDGAGTYAHPWVGSGLTDEEWTGGWVSGGTVDGGMNKWVDESVDNWVDG